MFRGAIFSALVALSAASAAMAAGHVAHREPVLKQIDLPHDYYWREQYLPQLTMGPSSAAFTPDGKALIYSMGGSLWRQEIGSNEATEITHAQGAYDYQPDVAADGKSVVFDRYDGAAIELWRLDLATGAETQLTAKGAVNVEPRLSPDGNRLAWVSTEGTGHFNLFVADVGAGGALSNAHPFLGERRTAQDRYYYSQVDHAINPAWSPDGKRLYYVSNPEIAWGTGDLFSVSASDPSDRRKLISEETMWSARSEPAPDGKRVLYVSYHGRQWRQLWLTTTGGAAPLPMSFGEFDRSDARWSPDGKRIALISNESGGTKLMLHDVVGGAETAVEAKVRHYKLPQARVTFDIRDETGKPVIARLSVVGSDGRYYAPDDGWMRGEDAFDRSVQKVETHYFHCASPCTVSLPAGATDVRVQRGFRYAHWSGRPTYAANSNETTRINLGLPVGLPPRFGRWVSADLHVHMNYGGHYRSTPERLAFQAKAEDLDVIFDTIVNKEERVPDVAYFHPGPDAASDAQTTILHAQEFHTSLWGHLGLLNLNDHLLEPGFASYRHTALASPYPYNGVIADLAHAQGGLVGYVHPYDAPIEDPAKETSLTHELPADMAHGKVDYIEITGFADHKATAEIWYRLLNLGYRLPAGAGTDAMTNYASLRGPVGLNRVFLDTGGERSSTALAAALKGGRTFASNGPLLGLELEGLHPGDTLKRTSGGKMTYRVALRSPLKVDHLELVANGKVVKRFKLTGQRDFFNETGTVDLKSGGWLVLRAWNDGPDPELLDLYPYATTSPIYLELPKGAPPSPADARFFVAWMDKLIAAADARDDYNTDEEKRDTLAYMNEARDTFRKMAGK